MGWLPTETSLFWAAGALLLPAMLFIAVGYDVNAHRIPNKLVLIGLAAGLVLNSFAPSGLGFYSAIHPGGVGLFNAVAGLLVGFGALLPLYLARGMGAGDVKLMAAVGTFLGPWPTVDAVLLTLLAGGVLGMTVALWNRTLRQATENIRFIVIEAVAGPAGHNAEEGVAPRRSAGKLPYAIAIAGGTCLQMLLSYTGHSVIG